MTEHDTFAGSTVRHGTPSGFRMHQHLEEPTCDSCRKAKSEYDQRRLETPVLKQRNRITAKAQSRALAELCRRHPDEYRQIYDDRLQAAFDEAAAEQGPDIYPTTWGPTHKNPRSNP